MRGVLYVSGATMFVAVILYIGMAFVGCVTMWTLDYVNMANWLGECRGLYAGLVVFGFSVLAGSVSGEREND